MDEYEDRFWTSRDGLELHYRDYAGAAPAKARPPVVCLPGLTRNARDFAEVAEHIAPGWRVICPEMRGRGDSEYAKDPATYNPVQYVEDLRELLAQLGIERFVAIGTSLGGLMTLAIAADEPGRIAGAVINDVGPRLEPSGFQRIKDYIGQGRSYPTWVHAARALEESQATAYPGKDLNFWIGMAKRLMTISGNGRIVFDYDMKIAEPFMEIEADALPDLWPGVEALRGRPVLVVRGALSDLFSAATMRDMLARLPEAEGLTLPGVGHAPLLTEPDSIAAIDRLLGEVA
ncbi:alpha/beta hydrolase [Novosphingobium sp. PC22D]|uniref:alpha/beta fold hydrolase n=1 Tax=Novosphingobium sp. PC22D TaxID=1962403 RepID=UPI000BF1B4CD|nr:alpha/beta hydrolase [Novosphingobium sp. PC22D]PEQ12951.1 alpha/beta hydrolase [Novosphingobium sp. PC22D]